jgi:hypothetical protein
MMLSRSIIEAGPSGFEPETAGFLPLDKSPVLYLAELRAHATLRSSLVQFNVIDVATKDILLSIECVSQYIMIINH